ncbi:MAG: M20/M25/M40 family metallo-hydrolase [Anaerolineaceae bacterium]
MNPLTMLAIVLGVLLVGLLIVLLARTLSFPVETEPVEPLELDEIDGESVAQRIGLAVQYRTIANVDPDKTDPLPFEGFRELLRTLYPQVDEYLSCEVINHHALLYTWKGNDPSLEPVCFTAHQDVVPADESENSGWTHPPFGGVLEDGYVWGRGTLDCKGTLIGILEAVNNLLKSGYQPERTVFLAFGDDEEVSGSQGARAIVETLQSRGVKLSFLLDEGGSVMKGSVPGVDKPIGLIGISEKGYLTLRLKSKVNSGHSSTPPEHTAIGALGLAIATLESNPFPQRLEVAQFMMSYLGKDLPFGQRMQYANSWLFGGALKRKLASRPVTNAITRTTAAPTMIRAGSAENVLPAEADALVNFRIMAGETIGDVYETVNDMVGDEVVEVLPAHGDTLEGDQAWNPTPVSDVDSAQFERLSELIQAAFPGISVAPFMMTGASDARHYAPICQNAFRFSPYFLTLEDSQAVHGVNERLSFLNAGRMVAFFRELIKQVSSLGPEADLEDEEEEEEEPELPEIQPEAEPIARPAKKASRPEKETPETLPDLENPQDLEPLPEDDAPLEVKPMKKE